MLSRAAINGICFLQVFLLFFLSNVHAGEPTLSNDVYTVTLNQDLSFCVQARTGVPFVCMPTFTVIVADMDPKLKNRPAGITPINYNVVSWEVDPVRLQQDDLLKKVKIEKGTAGDGFDESVLRGSTDNRTADLFAAANTVVVTAQEAIIKNDRIHFTFKKNDAFDLSATLTVSATPLEPVLAFHFTPNAEGYYSIGFTGMPETKQTEADEIWQPMIWQEKRFPDRSYMTLAYRCTIPATMVRVQEQTVALVADPEELPFDPLPVMDNSRFGVAVRNAQGHAQPMIFAPALGGYGSKMEAGKPFAFKVRLISAPGKCRDAYEQIARKIFGFTDYRHNAIASLNETLNNLLDYGMSEYSWFLEDLKGCSYSTDVPGAVKNVSSLSPLNMALVTDDPDIYQHRAYPLIEYMLSREKFLFSLDPKQKIQSPSRNMKGPCAPLTELAALYDIFRQENPVFLTLAKEMYGIDRTLNLDVIEKGNSWKNALALYNASGDAQFLKKAMAGADAYLAKRMEKAQTDFMDSDAGGLFFWTGFAPKWIDLLELYEQSGEQRYLDAAQTGARQFAMFVWMCPTIPDENILVNKDGKAPLYWYLKGKGHKQMHLPEEEVPAWRLSEMGLTSESSGTCNGHRAIFMANYAPWMLRLGYYANDMFLMDIARSAVIGRYRNFPGYHINTARTTVYEKADYPLRDHIELSVNSFHYNHIWPMMSMLFDYMVTDVFVRSEGKISFPSQFIEGYAYLQNKFYGHEPGQWYGLDDVYLWMPKDVLVCDNIELNYLTARSDDKLLIAFTNQANEKVTTTIRLNTALIGNLAGAEKQADVRSKNGAKRSLVIADGVFNITVEAKGIKSVEIEDVQIETLFQPAILERSRDDAWSTDYLEVPFGNARAMILPGLENKTAYLYLQSDDAEFSGVVLHYERAGSWKTIHDNAFPYEFTVPLHSADTKFTFYFEGTTVDRKVTRSKEEVLQHGDS